MSAACGVWKDNLDMLFSIGCAPASSFRAVLQDMDLQVIAGINEQRSDLGWMHPWVLLKCCGTLNKNRRSLL